MYAMNIKSQGHMRDEKRGEKDFCIFKTRTGEKKQPVFSFVDEKVYQ